VLRIAELTAADPDFAACFAIRLEVFVAEQNVPLAEERDEFDADAIHFLAWDGDTPVGTGRVILKDNGLAAKITRVAVRKAARGQGIGEALMRAIEASPRLAGANALVLDAQCHALAFYQRLGYTTEGGIFMEAGIPHQRMSKTHPQN
jgi:predicted GNAT family N-acyltransferase